jgi:hypothetical protein
MAVGELTKPHKFLTFKWLKTLTSGYIPKSMNSYTTLSEAISDLKRRGYTEDFNLKPNCIECSSKNLQYHPENFTVDEFHRFEGMSNTDDNSILFAVSSTDGVKGVLVDAYGMYAENLTEPMIQRLNVKH